MNQKPTNTTAGSSVRRAYKPTLDPQNLPPRVTRQDAASALYAVLGFPVSPRTLESWPVATRLVNGKATFDTAELLAFAGNKLNEAPSLRGGRKGSNT